MKLKNQVVSLKLAKQLKELGFKQDSLYIWLDDEGVVKLLREADIDYRPRHTTCFEYPAYTVAELGEMLPIEIEDNYLDCYKTERLNGVWECSYESAMNGHFEIANTEADARAKMLIYLKTNNLI